MNAIKGKIVLTGALALLLLNSAPVPVAAQRMPADDGELRSWLENMVWHHRFSTEEVAAATGMDEAAIDKALERLGISPATRPARVDGDALLVLPYPGGRHPRIGFLEGAIDPQRETKVSVFAPWDEGSDYIAVDVPEAIHCQHGILYLAHTHVPTVWTEKGVELETREWSRGVDGTLRMERTLPNGVSFGTVVEAKKDHVLFDMWLANGSKETLTDMRVQNCGMLKGLKGFEQLTRENKIFEGIYAACRNEEGTRWVIMAFDPIFKGWGNAKVPCLHADPIFPECAPGEKAVVKGWVSFYEGKGIAGELERIEATGWRSGAKPQR